MAVNKRESRKITIEGIEFRWRASGNDGSITVIIWPVNRDTVRLIGNFEYHHEFIKHPDESGCYKRIKGQIIITNRVIKKIIDHVTIGEIMNYKGQIDLGHLENIYDINNALRETINKNN